MRSKLILVGFVAAVITAEGLSYLGIAVANLFLWQPILTRAELVRQQTDGMRFLLDGARKERIDGELGWRFRPGYVAHGDTLNAAGMRSSRDYDSLPSDSLARIAAFGDSFVYCDEVSNDACWSSQLEQGWRVEALNYGVGGYGTDQAYLRFLREGRLHHSPRVLIGFAPIDLQRVVSRYSAFAAPNPAPRFKPRFKLDGERLTLVPSPVTGEAGVRALLANPERIAELGKDDYWYDPVVYESRAHALSATVRLGAGVWTRVRRAFLDPDRLTAQGVFRTASEAFAVQSRVMLAFADSVRASGATPVFVFFPSRQDVRRARDGGPASYAPLADRLDDGTTQVIDPIAALAREPMSAEDLFTPAGHYSASGNRVLARIVAEELDLPER